MNGREKTVAWVLLRFAIVLGVAPVYMFDIMNPSIALLTDSMQQGYQAVAPAVEQVSAVVR